MVFRDCHRHGGERVVGDERQVSERDHGAYDHHESGDLGSYLLAQALTTTAHLS